MTTMASHSSSATLREATPRTSKTKISNALKTRAQSLINNKSIDARSRVVIRYGLATNDPLLAELVRRAEAGKHIIEERLVRRSRSVLTEN
jgi:hypothetical protein